jgi:hypothetical protein
MFSLLGRLTTYWVEILAWLLRRMGREKVLQEWEVIVVHGPSCARGRRVLV